MQVELLSALEDSASLSADLLIIGGGPAGLAIAQQFAGSGIRVLVLESGLTTETEEHAALNAVENIGELQATAQVAKRTHFHGRSSKTWSHETQAFGVRCRALGGSTHAWAGKSAPFDAIDFKPRDWVDHSGWPFDRDELYPFIERAMGVLNLCPIEPQTEFESEDLKSFFWQFARSRIDGMDVMRFGAEVLAQKPEGLRVLLDATATRIALDETGTRFSHVDVASVAGKRARAEARFCVLAASGIENPRLLLASCDGHPNGLGNANDQVGRYLMDHPSAQIGEIPTDGMEPLAKRFGFYGVHHAGRAHMFMHGLAITPEMQQREQLLNAAVYFTPMRSPDDPSDALKRLIRWRSDKPARDLLSVTTGMGLLAKGVGMKVLADNRTPKAFKDLVINTAIRFNPNLVADEFQTQGVPHKMTGLAIDAITEQMPNPDSRVSLASQKDKFGVPLARVNWRINELERRTLRRIAELTCTSLSAGGFAAPVLADWVQDGQSGHAVIIDMGHTLGTTRMAVHPRDGVVNPDCKVHGVDGLYVAGGSVFPTSGHANPTLMILAVAIRLADHLKSKLVSG